MTIPNAPAGKYTISVIGTSVPQGPQLYSLVITGNFDYNPSCTNPGTVDPTPTDPNPGGPPVVIEPGASLPLPPARRVRQSCCSSMRVSC